MARAAASTTPVRSLGRLTDAAQRAAAQTSHASAGRSVWAPFFCQCVSGGIRQRVSTASPAGRRGTRRVRRPVQPAVASSASVTGAHTITGTKLRESALDHSSSTSFVTGYAPTG